MTDKRTCYWLRTMPYNWAILLHIHWFQSFSMTYHVFHDFPGLENDLTKFCDFPWLGTPWHFSCIVTEKIFLLCSVTQLSHLSTDNMLSRSDSTCDNVLNCLQHDSQIRWYDIVGFNVPLDTLLVISGTILRVRWPNQQCHGTEGRWLVNQVNGQSHQAQLNKT